MIQAKQELLQALQAVLAQMAPGAAARLRLRVAQASPRMATWPSPRPWALARSLKKNPRELAATLVEQLRAQPAVQRWVQDLEIAGPGFVNLRLKPAARQAVVAEVLRDGAGFGRRPARDERVLVEFVSANPTGPLHVGHARQAALGDSICNLFETQGWQVTREFYYNDAGVQIATLAASTQARLRGLKPGDDGWPEAAYNGDYIADIAQAYRERATVQADDREFTASGDIDDLDDIRQFAVAYLRREQDLDLQAFGVRFDHYFLESSLYTSGRVEAAVQRLVDRRRHLREGRRAVAAHHRLRRRQGPRDAQVGAGRHRRVGRRRRAVHLLRARRRLPHRTSSSAASTRSSTCRAATTTAPSPACAPGCRRRGWASRRASPTTCCTRW